MIFVPQLILQTISSMYVAQGVVLFADPALNEGKGLVYIKRFLGLDDVAYLKFCRTNQSHAM